MRDHPKGKRASDPGAADLAIAAGLSATLASLSDAILAGSASGALLRRFDCRRWHRVASPSALLVIAFSDAVNRATAGSELDETTEALLLAFVESSHLSYEELDAEGACSRLALFAAHEDVLEGRLPTLSGDAPQRQDCVWSFPNILHGVRPLEAGGPGGGLQAWLLDEHRVQAALTEPLPAAPAESHGELVVMSDHLLVELDQGLIVLPFDEITDLRPFADGAELHAHTASHHVRGLEGWFLAEVLRLLAPA